MGWVFCGCCYVAEGGYLGFLGGRVASQRNYSNERTKMVTLVYLDLILRLVKDRFPPDISFQNLTEV